MTRRIERIERMKENTRIRKEEEAKDFFKKVNKVQDNTDNIVLPSVSTRKEYDKNYIDYDIVKHPNCFSYDIVMRKKDYPFEIYYSKQYFENAIPKKYKNEFLDLMKCFEN